MAVSSVALTTLTKAKTQLGVSGSSDDTKLEQMIDQASRWIESQTERKLKARNYNGFGTAFLTTGITSEDYLYFSGNRRDLGGDVDLEPNGYFVYHLPQWPVQRQTVTNALAVALHVLTNRAAGAAGAGDMWDTSLTEGDDYIVDYERGKLILVGTAFEPGYRNYRIQCTAGYLTGAAQPYVPEDLELLCLKMLDLAYNDASGLQSERIGTWSRTFDTAKSDPFVDDTLSRYRRLSL